MFEFKNYIVRIIFKNRCGAHITSKSKTVYLFKSKLFLIKINEYSELILNLLLICLKVVDGEGCQD